MTAYHRLFAVLFGVTALSLVSAPRADATPAPRVHAAIQGKGHHHHKAHVVVVHRRPPALRIEVRTRRPGRRHVWIDGHWEYRHAGYVWVKGRWAVPPRAGLVYVRPNWKRHGRGYVFVAGGWR